MANGGKDSHSTPQFPTHNAPRVWLVTSGDSPVGISLAREVLNHGDYVVSGIIPSDFEKEGARSKEFKSFLSEVGRRSGDGWKERLKIVALDIRMMSQCQAAVAEAVYAFGRIDILLCCTSQAVVGTVEELSTSSRTQTLVRDQFETNFFGPVNAIKATIPTMREQKIGHMIVLGGITGHLGTPGLGMYCAANWALEGFCDSIAYEIAPFNIKVTIVQASIEIGVLLNRITTTPSHPAYSSENNNSPLFRGILERLLHRLPGVGAQHLTQNQERYSPASESEHLNSVSLLSRNDINSIYTPLSQAHVEKLLAETLHALTAIAGHENPPARHIVGMEGVASVKEKLKTVSEELEEFVEASMAVDIPRVSQGHAKTDAANMEDGPVDFGSHDGTDRHSHS